MAQFKPPIRYTPKGVLGGWGFSIRTVFTRPLEGVVKNIALTATIREKGLHMERPIRWMKSEIIEAGKAANAHEYFRIKDGYDTLHRVDTEDCSRGSAQQ
ncbi:hypothetical protein PTKIN_Ptkin08bG0044800 [Pterospermum kingtungense]